MREYRFYLIIGFLNGVAVGILWAIYAPYLRLLGYSATIYGFIAGSGVVVSAVSSLIAGILSDAIGSKRIAFYGLLLNILSYLLIYLGEFWSLLLASMLNGFSSGFYYTAYTVLVSKSTSSDKLHYAYSYTMASSIMGDALGLYLGWIPVITSNYTGIPLLTCYRYMVLSPVFIAVLSIYILERYIHEKTTRKANLASFDRLKELLYEYKHLPRGLYILIVSEAIIGFGAAMSIHNIDYYFTLKYGVTSGELGSVLGTQQLLMALLMFKLPGFVKRVGDVVKTYLVVTTPSIPLLIAMTYTNDYLVASIIYIIRSILMNLANPLFNALSMQITPENLRGRAASLLSLPWTLLGGLGRGVGGRLMDIDVELPLRITALLYVIGLSIIAVFFRREYVKATSVEEA